MRRNAVGRVLAQVDRREQAHRQRHHHRDRRHQQRAGDERQHAEVPVGEERRPLGAGQELQDRHLTQELVRLERRGRR